MALNSPIPFEQLVFADFAALLGMAVVIALTLHPWFWVAAVVLLLAWNATLRDPLYAVDALGIAFLVHNVLLAWFVRPRRPA